MRCLFRGVLFVFVQNTFLKSFDFIVFFAEAKYRFGVVFISKPEVSLPVFQAKKPEVRPPKKAFRFQVHYGHSKGNTPDGEKPKAGRRTLKTEYHSLGQNNETSVTRGPVNEDGVAEEANVECGCKSPLTEVHSKPTGRRGQIEWET